MTWLWRVLPFIGKALHLLEMQWRDARIADLEQQVEYWRGRAERLTDAALVRAGAIHEPTMVDRKLPSAAKDPASMIASALAITEIDSSKKKGAA